MMVIMWRMKDLLVALEAGEEAPEDLPMKSGMCVPESCCLHGEGGGAEDLLVQIR